jgi:hypothetical protein
MTEPGNGLGIGFAATTPACFVEASSVIDVGAAGRPASPDGRAMAPNAVCGRAGERACERAVLLSWALASLGEKRKQERKKGRCKFPTLFPILPLACKNCPSRRPKITRSSHQFLARREEGVNIDVVLALCAPKWQSAGMHRVAVEHSSRNHSNGD